MIIATERLAALCRLLATRCDGTVLIETAIIAPVLVLLAIGSFEGSRMISRQNELQSGVADAEAIALAANAGAKTDTETLKSLLMSSLSLSDNQVTVTKRYRCNADSSLVDSTDKCSSDAVVSNYAEIRLTDTYTPMWTNLGIGGPVDYKVDRLVMLP